MFFPPGYMSNESLKRIMAHKRAIRGGQTIEDMIERGIIIVGSPETVRRRIRECHAQLGFEHLLAMLHFGTLPHDLTIRNIELFATEVLPDIQTLSDADYRGFEMQGVAAQ